MFLVRRRVDEEVINVNNYIGEAVYNCLHEALEAGGAAQQAHRAGNPLKLAHAWHCESGVWACSWVQNHLPEPSGEVNGTVMLPPLVFPG